MREMVPKDSFSLLGSVSGSESESLASLPPWTSVSASASAISMSPGTDVVVAAGPVLPLPLTTREPMSEDVVR